jgi:Ca2+-transporting ATPase
MSTPPRNSEKSILSGVTGSSIIYQGFIQTLVVLIMFVIATHKFGNDIATTMSFLTICLMQIIHAINCKSNKSIFKMNIFKNHFFNFSFLFLLGLILAIYFISPLASLFSLCRLTISQWLIISITSIMIIPAVELGKLFIKG